MQVCSTIDVRDVSVEDSNWCSLNRGYHCNNSMKYVPKGFTVFCKLCLETFAVGLCALYCLNGKYS